MLTVLAGTASWLSAYPLPWKALTRAAPPSLYEGVAIDEDRDQELEVKYLTVADIADEESTIAYPARPEALAQASKAWVEDQLAVGHGGATIEVTFAPILAAGPYLGVRLTATTTFDTQVREQSHVLYTDVDSGATWTNSDLIIADAPRILARIIRNAAKTGELDVTEHPSVQAAEKIVRSAMAGAHITSTGLVLPLPELQHAITITEPAGLFTDAGEALAQAAAADEEFVGLPKPPASPPAPGTTITFPGAGDVDCRKEKCLALTFDDGPGPDTARLLDILATEDVRATFFVIGGQVADRPETVRRMVAEGHVVGNHTWGHAELPRKSRTRIRSEIDRTTQALLAAGAPSPRLFRPPYGALSKQVRAEIADLGYATILWDVDTLDWHTRNTKKTVAATLADARPGGIILMHDIHAQTVDATREIITGLKGKGFTLVTVPELLGGEVTVGEVYRNLR